MQGVGTFEPARFSVRIAAAGFLACGRVYAEPVTLRVDAPLECIQAPELQERVAELPHPGARTSELEVEIRVEPQTPLGYVADVTVRSNTGEPQQRLLTTASTECRELDEALLVVIDALVSSMSGSEAPEAGRPESSPPPAVRRERSQVSDRAPSHGDQLERISHSLSLGMSYDAGGLPDPRLVARLDARLAFAPRLAFRFGIGTTPWTAERRFASAEVTFRLTSGRAAGCLDLLAAASVYADICAGLDAGAVTTMSDGLERDSPTTRLGAWPLAEAAAGVVVGALVSEASVSAGPALIRNRYRVTDLDGNRHTLHRSAAFRWMVGIGVGVRVP